MRPETRIVFTESPANPTLKVTDLAAISEITRSAGVLHVTDNTFLTPYFQKPFELGANIVIHSTTKFLDGHNATLGGAVVVDDEELQEKISFARISAGLVMSPMVAWLTLQGVKTLSERMDRQSANALAIAEWLQGSPQGRLRELPGTDRPTRNMSSRSASGQRVWRPGVLRGARRCGDRQEAHGRRRAVESRREPGSGGIADHPPGHDDPRRGAG